MKSARFALIVFGFFGLSACSESNLVYQKHCKEPPANWLTESDLSRFSSENGVVDPEINLMKLDRLGNLYWNGTAISRQALNGFLIQLDEMEPKPNLVLDIENETPCRHVLEVRRIMAKSATCQSPKKLCTENLSFIVTPPPKNDREIQRN